MNACARISAAAPKATAMIAISVRRRWRSTLHSASRALCSNEVAANPNGAKACRRAFIAVDSRTANACFAVRQSSDELQVTRAIDRPPMRDLTTASVPRDGWDAIVVGTGIGGATLGHALASAGWRVLFCEKGKA